MKTVEFYFDFLSPYSYLAWTSIRDLDLKFEYYPVTMATIIHYHETKGPAEIVSKRNYLFREILRQTKLKKIPFTTPKNLPFNSLYALRLSLKSVAGDEQKKVIDAIYRAGWESGEDIGNDDILKQVLNENNLDTEKLFSKMEDRAARVELKENNNRAIEKGAFGVPTFIVENELFWGNDSISHLKLYLENKDPLDHQTYNEFIKKFN